MTDTVPSPGAKGSRPRPFSMIEVVLGLGLIAFGLISIAALFPSGLRANQVALGETYAAQHADQFLHVLKARMLTDTDTHDNWDLLAKALPESKPTGSEPTGTGWSDFLTQDVTSYSVGGGSKQFYRIVQKASASNDVQFSAICRVWRSPVTVSHYSNGSWTEIAFSADDAIGLNVEISWPVEKPYSSRRKSLYQIEVYHTEP